MSTAQVHESVESELETDTALRAQELLQAGTAAEWRLLKHERRAEKRLATARDELRRNEHRLLKAQQRLEQCRAEVATAEAAVRDAQSRRAAGPAVAQD